MSWQYGAGTLLGIKHRGLGGQIGRQNICLGILRQHVQSVHGWFAQLEQTVSTVVADHQRRTDDLTPCDIGYGDPVGLGVPERRRFARRRQGQDDEKYDDP